MKEMKLFEIPIYSMNEKIYEKRCFDYIEKNALKTTKSNYDFFKEHLMNSYFRNRPWQYNQIVGYIVISYKQNSIWFDEYLTFDKKIHAIGNKKHFIHNMLLNGHHFYLDKKKPSKEIKKEILWWLDGIEKNIINKPFYLEKELFLRQLEYTDILRMIGSD